MAATRRNIDAIFFDVVPANIRRFFHAMNCVSEIMRSIKNADITLVANFVFVRLEAKDNSSFPRGNRTTIPFDIFTAHSFELLNCSGYASL